MTVIISPIEERIHQNELHTIILFFAVASLLSCLHQLRAENLRLEEHVSSLLQRRDHLLAVNARLAIPLTGQPAIQQSHPHTGKLN